MMINQVLIMVIGFIVGILGSIMGVGGGFLMVPFLVLIAGIPMYEAIGTSLTAIVATSISASIVYGKHELINFKIGFILEIFTVIGVILGSYIAFILSENLLKIIFGAVLIFVSYRMVTKKIMRSS